MRLMAAALPTTAGVIGFGRFGTLWASILQDDFTVTVYDPDPGACARATESAFTVGSLRETLAAEAIFYCVPISELEPAVRSHLPHFLELGGTRTLIDVLSVKLHARDVFERYLPPSYHALLTHPLFGPDSVAAGGLAGQSMVIDGLRLPDGALSAWEDYFTSKGLAVVVMDADEHDRLAAASQGVTHFVGRTLERFGFVPTPIDTFGTKRLHDVTTQVRHDTWRLFLDLQTRIRTPERCACACPRPRTRCSTSCFPTGS